MNTIVVTDDILNDLRQAGLKPVESAGVLMARPVDVPGGTRFLVRAMAWVAPEHYALQTASALSILSEGYVHALGEAHRDGCVPFWFHTHPGLGSDPSPSSHDRIVDREIAGLFRSRSESKWYGALIASPREVGVAFSGFIEEENGHRESIDRIWSVGERLRFINAEVWREHDVQTHFDRNVRAFGPAIQLTLASLHIGIVGCGGTGSAVAEQLVRLGARQLTLIDPDTLSASNVTRLYGSSQAQVGQPKVTVVEQNLKTIDPSSQITSIAGTITEQPVAKRLFDCDVIFGCTDDNAGRVILSRLASYLLVPVFDCGVLLSSGTGGMLIGIDARVTTLVPGQACLICRSRIDLARAASEMLTPQEREVRVAEGYAPALLGIEPAVITFTTAIAALAVTELLERLIDFGDTPRPSELLYRGHDRAISTNVAEPGAGHYCDPAARKLGAGPGNPILEMTWRG